jgi:hypothetical protein
MTSQLSPVSSGNASMSPVFHQFVGLPPELQLHIIRFILESKDVANLNLVSKSVNSLNKESSSAALRVEYLFSKYSGIKFEFDPEKKYSYANYISTYSICDLTIDQSSESIPEHGSSTAAFYAIQLLLPNILRNTDQEEEVLWYALALFADKLHRPAHKLIILADMISPLNDTDIISRLNNQVIVRKFYNDLPEHMQTELRRQIWIANGESAIDSDGIDRGLFFKEHIIDTAITGPLVRTALQNYLLKFGVVLNQK